MSTHPQLRVLRGGRPSFLSQWQYSCYCCCRCCSCCYKCRNYLATRLPEILQDNNRESNIMRLHWQQCNECKRSTVKSRYRPLLGLLLLLCTDLQLYQDLQLAHCRTLRCVIFNIEYWNKVSIVTATKLQCLLERLQSWKVSDRLHKRSTSRYRSRCRSSTRRACQSLCRYVRTTPGHARSQADLNTSYCISSQTSNIQMFSRRKARSRTVDPGADLQSTIRALHPRLSSIRPLCRLQPYVINVIIIIIIIIHR